MVSLRKLVVSFVLVLSVVLIAHLTQGKEIRLKDLKRLSHPIKKACYSHDGIGVNPKHPTFGATGQSFPRLTPAAYTDGVRVPPRQKYSARELSNVFCKQEKCDTSNKYGVNAMFYAFAQFIDHDIDSMGTGRNSETFPIPVPPGDRFKTPTIPFTRGTFSSEKVIFIGDPVNQVNVITGYIDCSQIYGSDPTKAKALRTLQGGLLKVNNVFGEEFLPNSFVHTNGKFFSGGGNNSIIAGDDRVTEALPISIMQTIFLREHNRLARLIRKRFGICKKSTKKKRVDEYIYQTARAINCAQIQSITYREYLSKLLGKHKINPYKLKFDPDVNVTPANEFATAAYRFGHSLVSCELHRIDENGKEMETIQFKDAFNGFRRLTNNKGELEMLVRGLCTHFSQNLDEKIADGLRDFLFGPNVRLDLAASNIQRGRDAGLPSFNDMRKSLGLKPLSASQMTSDPELREKLVKYFGEELNDLDPWLGILIEPKYGNSQLGRLGTKIVKEQFERFVKGDPCFYTHRRKAWMKQVRKAVDRVTLADIIAANTKISRNDKALSRSAFDFKP